MQTSTQNVIEAIRSYEAGKQLAPVMFSYSFGRSACSAGFRKAKEMGLIKVAFISVAGTPCYERTEAA